MGDFGAGSLLVLLLLAGRPQIHSVQGVVRRIGSTSVTIAVGSGSRTREMTFVVTPATQREGRVEVGVTASIRYEIRGRTLVMTAVSTKPEADPDQSQSGVNQADRTRSTRAGHSSV